MEIDVKYMNARNADMSLLHHDCRADFYLLMGDLQRDFTHKKINVLFKPFEVYRHPSRQLEALNQKTSRARPYESAHQFGMAVDFVPFDPATQRWSWRDGPHWDYLRDRARARKLLCELNWDRAHVEHPRYADMLACMRSM